MIQVRLSATGLAAARFAVSPLYETMGLLMALRARRGGFDAERRRPRVGRAIDGGGLDLLASITLVHHASRHYVPDFLTPDPVAPGGSVEAELHAVATTDTSRVRAELDILTAGRRLRGDSGIVGRELPRLVSDAVQTGERDFAERVAGELDVVWRTVLAPEWPRMRARLEQDIALRGHSLAREGLAGTVGSLAPSLDLTDGVLTAASRYEVDVTADSVVFVPTAFHRPTVVVDPCPVPVRRSPVVLYPAVPATPSRGEDLAGAVGRTRARLLDELATPRSTGELAERLGLSASTVSYHLQGLLRAGLVTRVRRSRTVYYHREQSA
ncbi:helix-turn-helix domain-containing protein [Kutzneria buriramensis]|uniref:Helix-turn-helix protein n=1 Tax=Kutzneria buriramensis TaxID=1045776 RepID=A0A3E0I758_9PSEU|nr:helix-turn-helix domain-containing protein [Kutzneria buriramensis]REH54366.1 helix-turn-helix protein [Kutzneria buriramensis]